MSCRSRCSLRQDDKEGGFANCESCKKCIPFDYDSSSLCENLALETFPSRADQILLT